ncbi:MAG: hypothetical protein FWD64_08980 [Acidobacteriaceae bacterium]|nr:hypothetical protein [Acidobacteriaceae bacterium]
MKNRIVWLAILVIAATSAMWPQGNVSKQRKTTLTVKAVLIGENLDGVKALNVTDENGKAISIQLADLNEWLENATIDNITVPRGTRFSTDENGDFRIVGDARLQFDFKVNGKTYAIGVGAGSKLAVQKTADGKYNLLAEETAKLSPPPATGK